MCLIKNSPPQTSDTHNKHVEPIVKRTITERKNRTNVWNGAKKQYMLEKKSHTHTTPSNIVAATTINVFSVTRLRECSMTIDDWLGICAELLLLLCCVLTSMFSSVHIACNAYVQ